MTVNKTVKTTIGKQVQKVLLPTLKEQQRYLVYHVIAGDNPIRTKFQYLHENIYVQCSKLLGIFEGAKAGLIAAKYNEKTQMGILRINHDYVDKLKVCLGLIKNCKIDDKTNSTINVIIDCIYVSGMLNKADDIMNKGKHLEAQA